MPEPALPRGGADGAPCRACDAPLAADQRYCLACGARRGARGPIDFAGLLGAGAPAPPPAAFAGALRRGGSRAPAAVASAGPPRGTDSAALPAAIRGALRFLRPPLPVFTTMLLILLGAGVALGSLSSPRSAASVAAQPVDVVLPAPSAATSPVPPPAAAAEAATIVPAPANPATPLPAADPGPAAADPTDPEPAPSGRGDGNDDGDATTPDGTDPEPESPTAPIEHVFVIRLGEAAVPYPFAASPYLKTLAAKGTLLRDLRTVAGSGLADAVALLSGQAPNPQTLAGCPVFTDVAPATIAEDGREQGEGCVYPARTSTLPNQLDAQGLAWRAYVEDQAAGGPGVAATCRRPPAGAPDPWRDPRPGDAYVTARNPFVYFRAIADAPACATAVADLAELDADLAKPAGELPAFSYVVPNACHDGRAAPCLEGAPAGPATADAFLAALLPKIMASKAWPRALVIVSFDRAFAAPPATPGAEGGKVGALLLSPRVRAGRVLGGRYDTYSLLAMIEDVFGLERLAGATRPAKRLGPGVFEQSA